MQHKLLKYILDIESVIEEIEKVVQRVDGDFKQFIDDILIQRAAERDLEIIGEAVRNIRDQFPEINISSSNKIIGLRNLIAHAYDSVEPEMLWGIIQRNIPVLKKEIQEIKKSA